MKRIRNTVGNVVNAISYVGMAVCFVMVFIVAFDVVLRKVSQNTVSIKGSNEFSSYFLIVICMLAIPALQVKKGHIWVNMFVDKFPTNFRSVWLGIITLAETVIVGMFVYGSWQKFVSYIGVGRTDVLNMPKWPFALVCLIGFFEFFVLLLLDSIIHFQDSASRGTDELPNPGK